MSGQLKAVVLLVDDDENKASAVRRIWREADGPTWSEILEAKSISAAHRMVRERAIDLLILDLKIPRRDRGLPDEEEAKRFLEDLHEDSDIRPPREVLILSAFESVLSKERDFYHEKGWTTLLFGEDLLEWQETLKVKFEYLGKRVRSEESNGRGQFEFDYCFITALKTPELDPFLRLPYGWESTGSLDSSEFHVGKINTTHGEKRVVCGNAFRMGMVHSSVLCAKAWHYFRPRFIIMGGIAAGVASKTNFGDILIVEEVWDYGAGKLAEDKRNKRSFTPDPRHVNAEHSIVEALWNLGQKHSLLTQIEDAWIAKRPATHLQVHKGPVASGAAVVASSSVVDEIISGNRKLIGLEMEAFGVYSACEYLPRPRPRFICVKSVCDFADAEKDDDFQEYAAFTSCQFIHLALSAGILEQC